MCKNKKQETKALRQGGKRLENHLDIVHQVLEQVNQVILGKREEIREVMLAFLAKGHALLEDIPGVGKTTLAVAFSRTMLLDYKRVQYTGWNLSVQLLRGAREEAFGEPGKQKKESFQAAWRSCLKVRVHLLSRMKRPVKLLYYIRVSFRWFSP